MASPVIQQVVVVPAPQEQVMSQVMSVSGADSYAPAAQSYDSLTLQRRRIPVWAIVLAIIFFPIGLLFLLVKDTEVVQITLTRVEGGTQVTIAGRASAPLQSALQYALAGYQATPAGLPPPTGPPPGGQPAGYGAPAPPTPTSPPPPPPGGTSPGSGPNEPTEPLPGRGTDESDESPKPRIPPPYGPAEPAAEPPPPPPPPPAQPPPGAPGGLPGGLPGAPPPAPSFGPPGGEQWEPPAPPGSPPKQNDD